MKTAPACLRSVYYAYDLQGQRMTEAWWTTSGGMTPFYGIGYDDLGARPSTRTSPG